MQPSLSSSYSVLIQLLLSLLTWSIGGWSVVAQPGTTTNLLDNCPANWALGVSTACEFTPPEFIAYRSSRRYYFTIPLEANYDLAITVMSTQGDIDLQLLAPNGTLLSASSERIGEDVVQVGRVVLSRTPGNYTLVLLAVAQLESWYSVKVQTPVSVARLALEDKALVSAIATQCCPADDDLLPDACTMLFAATNAIIPDENDLCLQPPNMCNEQGRLTKLVLSGGDRGNFVCPSFPHELGQLAALEVLEWSSNSQVGTLASVAAVLAPLSRQLKRLYLGGNALTGSLGCEIVSGTSLEILRLERNLLSGSIPACLFQSPSLQQLSLAGNRLSGTFPPLPPDCALKLLDVSVNRPSLGWDIHPGIQGPFPDVSQAPYLTYLNVQNNSLTGTLPPQLPRGIQVLRGADNSLTGTLPPAWTSASDLRVLDLARNHITGSLPPGLTSSGLLTLLRLAGNQLVGELPSSGWAPYLMDVDLSDNNFTAQYVPDVLTRTSLIRLNLAANYLSFDMQQLSNLVPVNNSILYFNISYNNVYGQLNGTLGRMLMFNNLEQAVQDDEALQGSLPPQPIFDVRYNLINSTFPLQLLPLLSQLCYDWDSDDECGFPLDLRLQPQKPPASSLSCPLPTTAFPPAFYLDELQQKYDMTCMTMLGQKINISMFRTVTLPQPPKRPTRPPRPPSTLRPPPRRPQPASSPSGNISSPVGGAEGQTGLSTPAEQANTSRSGSGDVTADQGALGGAGEAAQHSVEVSASPLPSLDGPQVERKSSADSNVGAIAGGLVGGLLLVGLLVGAALFLHRRNSVRRSLCASKRVPLTFNSAYEAPSEGTASLYGDMQMFEFNTISDRPPRHRTRLP